MILVGSCGLVLWGWFNRVGFMGLFWVKVVGSMGLVLLGFRFQKVGSQR